MRAQRYVVPILTNHSVSGPDSAIDDTEWASEIAGLRARVMALSDVVLTHYLPRCNFADLMGLVVSKPFSAELQSRIAKLLFPTFLSDGFLRQCTRCGERVLPPAVAAGMCERIAAVLAGQRWPSVPKTEECVMPEKLAHDEEETFLTDEEVDALLEGVTLPEPSVNEAATPQNTAAATGDAPQAEADLQTLANDPLRLACYVKGMPNAALKLLLVEQEFGLYEDTLANFLWFMKDGELIGKVLQRMTLHDGRLLMEKLNALWFGKNPGTASLQEKQAGQSAANAIVKQICMINDEGRMV